MTKYMQKCPRNRTVNKKVFNIYSGRKKQEIYVPKRESRSCFDKVACSLSCTSIAGKNNRFPFLDILGYLKNTHNNPKFGKVRQVPTTKLCTKAGEQETRQKSVSLPPKAGELTSLVKCDEFENLSHLIYFSQILIMLPPAHSAAITGLKTHD